MRVARTIRLIAVFYKNFLLAAALITACCLVLFREYGYSIFMAIFWLKAASLLAIYRFINSYKKSEFYYYHNLGLSKAILWGSTLAVDFLVFLLLLTQMHRFI